MPNGIRTNHKEKVHSKITLSYTVEMRRNPNKRAHASLRDAVDVTRFWSLVDRGGPDDCWTWLGDVDKKGYGVFSWHGEKKGAHQMALSFSTGEVKDPKLDTCHSCDNPPCCNPRHVRFDTRASNMRDAVERGQWSNGDTKLTEESVRTIRERRAAGARQQDLAEQYGVSDGLISMIVRGTRWPKAGGPIEKNRQYAKRRK